MRLSLFAAVAAVTLGVAGAAHAQFAWETLPTAAQVTAAYPTRAQFEGVEGRAVIGCTIGANGHLEGCTVVSEDPAGYGFGEATLAVAPRFKARMSTTRAGQPIRLPLSFRVPEGETATPPAPAGNLVSPTWAAQPTAAELSAGAPQSRAGGRALMDCRTTAEGGLEGCTVVSQTPATGAFGPAALALAPRYRLAAGAAPAGTPVRVAVVFPRR